MPTKVIDVIRFLENAVPVAWQENYDNAGLIAGNPQDEVKGILLTLDCTEAVLQEAIDKGCNLVIAHHPILFKPIKKITADSGYAVRAAIMAIKNNINIYAAHTHWDNWLSGVNHIMADQLQLANRAVLQSKPAVLMKLETYIPETHHAQVLQSLFAAGAGHIGNYEQCSFSSAGQGTFMPVGEARPFSGELGRLERAQELKAEVIFPAHRQSRVMSALRESHPYEEAAHYLFALENKHQQVGAGLIGDLSSPMPPDEFLQKIAKAFSAHAVRHTDLSVKKEIRKVALCGGAGSFLTAAAKAKGADIFVSADFKYHEFFDADGGIIVADIGHYETEHLTKRLFYDFLKEKFTTFAIIFSTINTNPISYYINGKSISCRET